MGNSMVFPAPKQDRTPIWMEKRLYFCNKPRKDEEEVESGGGGGRGSFLFFCCDNKKIAKKIPYLYFKEDTDPKKSQYLLLYFHGNSENLTHVYKTLERYHQTLKVSFNIIITQ